MSLVSVQSARVTAIEIAGGAMAKIRFQCDSRFRFEAGQFVSILVPTPQGFVKRLYSLANSPEHAKANGYELCIKLVSGGKGSTFLCGLKPGDEFQFHAPYGHFEFHPRGRPVVFLGTGSGVAPLRSIVLSNRFQQAGIPFALAVLGFRTKGEVPYWDEFEKVGVATRYAISRENCEHPATKRGRLTDVLRDMKSDFPWADCDFYLCGNSDMIEEVRQFLAQKRVPKDAIFFESFSTPAVQMPVEIERKVA